MKLPNKVTSYQKSILSKLSIILTILKEDKSISIQDLYNAIKKKFDTFDEFLEVMTCLYALNKIEFDYEYGVINYVV